MTTTSNPTPVQLRIQPIGPHDREVWQHLWAEYLRFYESSLPEAQFELNWQRLHQPNEPMHGWLAWVGDQAAGLAHGIVHRSFWTADNYLYLQDLYVLPQHRGQGVGQALIEHLSQLAPSLGCNRVHWLTQTHNTTARALYDRVATATGFVQYKRPAKEM